MTNRKMRLLAAVLSLAFFGVGTASATTNVFVPKSGAAFRSDDAGVTHSNGMVVNRGGSFATVVVSLGHAQGGANGFTIYGMNLDQGTIHCSVQGVSDLITPDGFFAQSESTTGPFFSMFIPTNPPPGNYQYTVSCILPLPRFDGTPTAGILGVKPDH